MSYRSVPSAQCPVPSAQCPVPNSFCLLPYRPIFGNVNEKTEPPPMGWATQMRPPCVSTSRLAMARPRPAPLPASRERDLSPR